MKMTHRLKAAAGLCIALSVAAVSAAQQPAPRASVRIWVGNEARI